jgi:hypothetical protein
MKDLYELFIKDRRYSKGVSARTEGWYRESWRAFAQALSAASAETLSKSDFTQVVEALCRRGVSPITINTYARAINAFLRWLHEEERCPKLVRIPRLKEPETVVVVPKLHGKAGGWLAPWRIARTGQHHQRHSAIAKQVEDQNTFSTSNRWALASTCFWYSVKNRN